MRRTIFVNDEYYHIYNRGVDKRKVFLNKDDYIRFIVSMREFNRFKPIGSLYKYKKWKEQRHPTSLRDVGCLSQSKLVEFIAYCLNPNHYHFMVKQLTNNGISEFMKRLGNGYTKYFNYRHNHSGYLFQGRFKSIHINSNEYLLWLSAYINLNPKPHKITNNLKKYPWSSYLDYTNQRNGTLCNKDIILNQFSHRDYIYKNFIDNCLLEMKNRKDLKKYFIE